MLRFSSILLGGALILSGAPTFAQSPNLSPAISAPARVLGAPGLRREAGTWLFNDSIFVAPGDNRGVIGASPFLANLRRDKKNKLPLFMPAKSGAALGFATLPLPTLRQMSAPNFDFAGLQSALSAQVNAARGAGSVYVGWSLPAEIRGETDALASLDSTGVLPLLKRLRAVLDAVAPDSALILEVETAANPSLAVADIAAAASGCDAVLLTVNPAQKSALWPLKMARRIAEEQPDFDLPIFVAPLSNSAAPADKTAFDAQLLEFWMGGATGFVLPRTQTPAWESVVARNPGLFAGAVTLEDAAVLPSFNPRTLELVSQLRAAGRVPLAGRLPDEKSDSNRKGESLLAILDDQTTLETLKGIDKAARAGNAIYLEGTPNLKDKAIFDKLSDITNVTLEVLAAPRSEVLTLGDAWLFGDARGREIGVTQRVKWTLKSSLAAQARKKKGEDALQAFSAAKLANDPNGLLIAPLGKGRIEWLAHAPLGGRGDEVARRDYYAAIAGSLQGGLARLRFDSISDEARNGANISLALRASKTGTPIIALFNAGNRDALVTLGARSDAPIALDLGSEREIVATVSGYSSNVKITVPARGTAWLTFGATRAALDKERLAPRPKARNR